MEFAPSSLDTISHFDVMSVFEADDPTQVFQSPVQRQIFYMHIPDGRFLVLPSSCLLRCIAHDFCLVGVELQASFRRFGAELLKHACNLLLAPSYQ